jgi:uncharacterized membrane protein
MPWTILIIGGLTGVIITWIGTLILNRYIWPKYVYLFSIGFGSMGGFYSVVFISNIRAEIAIAIGAFLVSVPFVLVSALMCDHKDNSQTAPTQR